MPFLFCYGSNNPKQIYKRTGKDPTTYTPIPAYLPNHARIFCGYSKRWNGGVASVYPKKDIRVYGIIIDMSEDELHSMDEYETGYIRKIKYVVNIETHKKMKCHVYMKTNYEFTALPSLKYINAIKTTLTFVYSRNNKNNNNYIHLPIVVYDSSINNITKIKVV